MARKAIIATPYKGGKANMVDWVISNFPTNFKKYVEPFSGGFSVGLNMSPVPTMIYNDLNEEMVNFFTVLRDRGDELTRLLELTPYARDEFNLACIFEPNDELEQARRTAVKGMMSFNGRGFRAVANNNTSAPKRFSRYVENLGVVIEKLRGVTIENRDALELIKVHDSKETLYYFDPPYVGTDDYAHGFTLDQHRQLADQAKSVKGMVVVSGYRSKLYDELYPKELFRRVEKSVNAGSIQKGSMRTEVLWISKNIPLGLFTDVGGGGS